ncbi:hypothetical protein TIFTF001_016499 [Ficus carica]|uniref:Uncharacterized protein n=1 Tax=Ficus carica TaxID=3494 RepID=A0AA88D7G9_FICCA|nr:hypothetical protein TIFTF001_016499 [Ficus carica]
MDATDGAARQPWPIVGRGHWPAGSAGLGWLLPTKPVVTATAVTAVTTS